MYNAYFGGVASTNADGSENSTFEFPLIEMPLGRIIDFENQKIIDTYAEYTFTGTETWTKGGSAPEGMERWYLDANTAVVMSVGSFQFGVSSKFTVLVGQSMYESWRSGNAIAFGYQNGMVQFISSAGQSSYSIQSAAKGMTIRYPLASENYIETPFTDEQKAAVAQYKAWKGGTETVQGNDNAAYGAMNTITQTYCTLNDYYSDAIENSEFLSINGSDTLGYYVDVYFQEGLRVTLPISPEVNKKFTLSADTAVIATSSSHVYTLSGKSCGKAHKAVGLKGYTATCTESGLTDGSVCLGCGAVLQTQEEIPALGHDGVAGETCGACGETIAHTAYTLAEPTVGESAIGNWYRIYLGEATFASVTFFDGTNNFYYDVYSEYHWVEAIQGESGDGNPFPYIEGTDEQGAYVEIYIQSGTTFTATALEGESISYEITDNVTFEGCTGGEIYRLDFEEASDE